MAQYRQSGGFFDSHGGGHNHALPDYHRAHPSKPSRIRRPGKAASCRRLPAAAAAVSAAILLLAGVFLLSRRITRNPADISQDLGVGEVLPEWNQSKSWKELKFGHGGGGRGAQNSRYWDRDDRRRDDDYSDYEKEKISGGGGNTSDVGGSSEKGVTSETGVGEKWLTLETNNCEKEVQEVSEGGKEGTLYNEGGRKELEQYEATAMGAMGTEVREVDPDDEYDDGIDTLEDIDDAQMRSSDGGRKLGDGGHETAKTNEVTLERHIETGGRFVDRNDITSMDKRKVPGNSDKKHGSRKKP